MKAILQENKIIGTYSPDEAVFIGSAAAKYSKKRIAIGRNGYSRAAEMALSAGIIASGSDVISLGKCLETELFLRPVLLHAICLYIKEEPLMKIEVRTKGGLPIDRQCMEIISSACTKEKFLSFYPQRVLLLTVGALKTYTDVTLKDFLPSKCPYSIYISKSGKNGQKIHFPKTEGEELIIQLSADGTKKLRFTLTKAVSFLMKR